MFAIRDSGIKNAPLQPWRITGAHLGGEYTHFPGVSNKAKSTLAG